jgi:hypothetical protein
MRDAGYAMWAFLPTITCGSLETLALTFAVFSWKQFSIVLIEIQVGTSSNPISELGCSDFSDLLDTQGRYLRGCGNDVPKVMTTPVRSSFQYLVYGLYGRFFVLIKPFQCPALAAIRIKLLLQRFGVGMNSFSPLVSRRDTVVLACSGFGVHLFLFFEGCFAPTWLVQLAREFCR